jgi:hypothetical protein
LLMLNRLNLKDEFGQWRPACNRFGEYVAAYSIFTQISLPEEDFEGRLDLYRLWDTEHLFFFSVYITDIMVGGLTHMY